MVKSVSGLRPLWPVASPLYQQREAPAAATPTICDSKLVFCYTLTFPIQLNGHIQPFWNCITIHFFGGNFKNEHKYIGSFSESPRIG